MIKSMTGYGVGVSENEELTVEVEIKTVNNKYCDIQIRMPSYLNFLDDKIRKSVKGVLHRGRIELYLKTRRKDASKISIHADLDLATATVNTYRSIIDKTNIAPEIRLNDILFNKDIVSFEEGKIDEENTGNTVMEAVEKAISLVNSMRTIEGRQLHDDLSQQLDFLMNQVDEIEERAPLLAVEYKEKISTKIKELLEGIYELPEERLAVEVALFAEKADINEEIVRIRSHVMQFRQNLNVEGSIGKKMDFLAQELNREINTISSKSNDIEITNRAIEVKSIIEKIREQIQNVE